LKRTSSTWSDRGAASCPEVAGRELDCNDRISDFWYAAFDIAPYREDADMTDFPRITQNPAVMGGKPCIRGLRVTVGTIVGQIGAGRTVEELLADYPYLEREDIPEALRYAAWRAEEREIELTAR
jgi:uncharacterized protein (DUF433 family)